MRPCHITIEPGRELPCEIDGGRDTHCIFVRDIACAPNSTKASHVTQRCLTIMEGFGEHGVHSEAIVAVFLWGVGCGEVITKCGIEGQSRCQLMPHTSADGMHLEWRVRVPRLWCPIGAKTLEGH